MKQDQIAKNTIDAKSIKENHFIIAYFNITIKKKIFSEIIENKKRKNKIMKEKRHK